MNRIAKTVNSISKKFGYRLIKIEKSNWSDGFVGISKFEKSILNICSQYSMTGFERMYFLIKAIEQIKNNKIQGDFVECGVWKGGNLILFQKMIEKFKLKKKIYAFDTFEGMTAPQKVDQTFLGESSIAIFKKLKRKKIDPKKNTVMAECSIEDVKNNFRKNTNNNKNLICIKGPVEKTLQIKKNLPKKISILRLDTDWYQSTKIELIKLFPLVEKKGIIIIDDYGYWKGARKAVDEYFKNKNLTMFKIDFTGRLIIKI
jgi:O-methyltransferase